MRIKERLVKKLEKPIALALFISLMIHIVVGSSMVLVSRFTLPQPFHKKMEVELMDPNELAQALKEMNQPSGQIVEQDSQVNDEIDKNTKYLSKFNQKVVQETQAMLNGRFKNTDGTAGPKVAEKKMGKPSEKTGKDVSETKQEVVKNEKQKEILEGDDVPNTGRKPSLKDLTPSFRPGVPRVDDESVAQGGGDGPSASDDRLKDVKKGMQTMLSTREFVYYSYYNRIKEKLHQYWEPKIKEKIEHILRQGRTIASTGDKITRIVIILDEKGVLQKVQVLGPSGISDLDDAAVEAFRAAAPFPNPPKGIIDSDGTIKIRWDFVLEA